MTKEELKNYKHALMHIEANKILNEHTWEGWYSGKETDFIKRHQKALTMFRELIKEAEKWDERREEK